MSEDNREPRPTEARMVLLAVILVAFVWVGLFIVLPAVTGKPGVAQQMQNDLRQETDNGASQR